jgi:hypothetical protein
MAALELTPPSSRVARDSNVLRPRNSRVYAPRFEYVSDEKMRIAPPGRGLFSWVGVLWRTKEDELVSFLRPACIVLVD